MGPVNTTKNKKKNVQKKSLSGKYLLMFFTTAFIPAFIACLSLLFIFQALEDEVINSNQASTRLIQQSLDIKISELNNTLLQMSTEPALTRYSLENNSIKAIDTLKQLTSLQECLDDIIIINKENSYLYSSSGKLTEEELVYQSSMKILVQRGYSLDDWMHKLTNTGEWSYWPTNAIDHIPTHLYLFSPVYNSFQYSGSDTTRAVVFLINQEFLHDLFRSSQTSMEENILLLNSDFEVLSYIAPNSDNDEILSICEKLKASPQAIADGYMNLDGKNLLFVSYSSTTELYCVRYLSRSVAYQSLYRLGTVTFILLALVLVVSVALIIWDMKKSYVPIRTLADSIIAKHPHHSKATNELVLFKQAYDDAYAQNEKLTQTIDRSRQGLINHLMATLIQGRYSEAAFRDACHNLDIQLDQPYYCLCSMLFEGELPKNEEPSHVFSQLVQIIKQELPDGIQVIIKDMLFEKRAIVLLNGSWDRPEPYLDVIRDMKARVFDQANIITSIGVGTVCHAFEEIGKAYLESSNALDYRMIYGKDCMITPDMCQNHLQEENYPSQELKQLHGALSSCNIEEAMGQIQQIYQYTKSQKCSLHSAKYICYDVFSALKRLPEFPGVGPSAVYAKTLDISSLVSFETVDDFFHNLIGIVSALSRKENVGDTDNVSDFCEQLTLYIHDRCFQYDFQINSMAEHFRISPQHMRKIFKNHTGVSISDYIAQLKLQKAMLLLRSTDMSISDIVLEIGNSDISGFIRFFKKYTNQTPGQYRKLWQQSKEQEVP